MRTSCIIVMAFVGMLSLSGCISSEVIGKKPDGSPVHVLFYTGGSKLDDLVIIDNVNYFGKAEYQTDNPLGDIGFKLSSGERVQAECSFVGKDIIGNEECKKYKVYRSSWPIIPEGSEFDRPEMF